MSSPTPGSTAPPPTLLQFNLAPLEDAVTMLGGVYEHSPWIARSALAQRPFQSLAQLKYTLAQVVHQAPQEAQLALIRAHPQLAAKTIESQALTPESSNEQRTAGLTNCTPAELKTIQQLNRDYLARFGFPFILAVRGPRGLGLSKSEIIATFQRRLTGHPSFELQECLRNIHRIAELRLNDKFGSQPNEGNAVWDQLEALAQYSEYNAEHNPHHHNAPGHADQHQHQHQLTVTYLTDAHRACAAHIAQDMRTAGCDSVHMDAVGNVVGCYYKDSYLGNIVMRQSPILHKKLLTGSHYDTVRNAGKYDGRLGIYVPLACVQMLKRQGKRLPFDVEIVAFAEEEGQRFKATFLGSSALVGDFNPAWLDQIDAQGISMRQAMQHAGLNPADIDAIRRDPAQYLGFLEVHIEQGPVLNALHLPLGIVTSINASVRYQCELRGMASHAGTTPMGQRRDAAAAAAELVLYMEQRAAQDADAVATVGMLQVPNGSVNVVPGRCLLSLDMRAPSDAQRDALVADVLAQLHAICERRGVQYTLTETLRAPAAPSAPQWQTRWESAVTACGLPLHRMPSGAGHDAMKLHTVMPQAMLFVRGQNAGISHNPLECTTSDDIQLAVQAFDVLLHNLAQETNPSAT